MEVILDTSFILTCIKQKIDFFEELSFKGFKIFIPSQVISELKGLAISKSEANLALKILHSNSFKKLELNGRKTDNAIINYSKKHPEVYIATLDNEIIKKTRNRKIAIKGKKRLSAA
ncbi:MAG: PIN domain-containing protein [Nanoarchaeota archaeon]